MTFHSQIAPIVGLIGQRGMDVAGAGLALQLNCQRIISAVAGIEALNRGRRGMLSNVWACSIPWFAVSPNDRRDTNVRPRCSRGIDDSCLRQPGAATFYAVDP